MKELQGGRERERGERTERRETEREERESTCIHWLTLEMATKSRLGPGASLGAPVWVSEAKALSWIGHRPART